MITLEVLSDACRTSPLSINTSSIVSMAPVRQNIEEVNGRSANDLSFTEISLLCRFVCREGHRHR